MVKQSGMANKTPSLAKTTICINLRDETGKLFAKMSPNKIDYASRSITNMLTFLSINMEGCRL